MATSVKKKKKEVVVTEEVLPESAPEPTDHSLWLTDRSRQVAGSQDCMTSRFWEYHAGPDGYGLRPKSESIPPATGTRMHDMLADLTAIGFNRGKLDVVEDAKLIREVLASHGHRYKALVLSRGFNDENAPDAKEVVAEQTTLMEGLGWAFLRAELPRLIEDFEVHSIEREEELVVDCTCGLGEEVGDFADHVARGCNGIGHMSRPDLLLIRKSDGTIGNHDWKLKSEVSEYWKRQWTRSVQMAASTQGAERRIGKPLSHYYIHTLLTGKRSKRYVKETKDYSGPMMQQSNLCYCDYSPAAPPVKKAKWERGGRWYLKQPVWTQNFPKRPEQTNSEYWVSTFDDDELKQFFDWVGPHPRPDDMLEGWLAGMKGQEREIQAKLHDLYQTIGDPEYRGGPEEILLEIMKRFHPSWNCQKYGRDCAYIPLCYRQPGWEDPLGSGRYIVRRPHHAEEIRQMQMRGVPVTPEGVEADLGEE